MKQKILLTSLVVVGFGCQLPLVRKVVLEKRDVPIFTEAPADTAGNAPQSNLPIVGFTKMGEVVIFDGKTGNILSLVEGGGGVPRDVAMDPWRNGVWVFEENEDATGGEILFCPLVKEFGAANPVELPTKLEPCEHSVWIDGLATILPTLEGLWVFEDGIGGSRYKVIGGPELTPSVSAPRPASLWLQDDEIEVFSYGFQNDRLKLFRASMTPAGPLAMQTFDWGEPLGYPPTARYAWFSRDAGLLFDAVSNAMTVRRVAQGEIGVPLTIDVGMPVTRIEAASSIGASTLVLGRDSLWLVSGGFSESLVMESGVEFVAGLWLHGDVHESTQFFSRDLLVSANRAFVGTDRGVRAVVLENDNDAETGVKNMFYDEQFVGEVLRGPLDMVRPDGS